MTTPNGNMIPEDALDKATEAGKTRDVYADLTDEEREEEGLPPRETPEKEPKPAEEPEPEQEEEEVEEEEPAEPDEATDRLFKEIAGLRGDLNQALGKSEEAPAQGEEDTLLAAALESEDPTIRGLAERIQRGETRLAAIEAAANEAAVEKQLAKDDADFDAVQQNYTVGGRPMTDADIAKVERWLLAHPRSAAELSIEEATRAVFPDAVKKTSKAPGRRAAAASGDGPPVATIVEGSGPGGAPAAPWKPGPNETIESAVQAAGRRFGWTR